MSSYLSLVTRPSDVVTIEQMRAHLRVTATGSPPSYYEDGAINLYKRAATSELDGPEGWLGRALGPQVWDYILDEFCDYGHGGVNPYEKIRIPAPPLLEVQSVTYYSADGTLTTMTEGVDYVVELGGASGGWITPAVNQTWPQVRDLPASVIIRFRAGYESSAPHAPEVPNDIVNAIMLIAADSFAHRETQGIGASRFKLDHVVNKLEKYRVRGFERVGVINRYISWGWK